MILQGLKPRIFDRLKPYVGRWVKEFPSVLWALRTTLSHARGHTLFSLVYGSEAMLPIEVEHKSFQVQHFNEERLDDSRVNRNYVMQQSSSWLGSRHQQAMR
jgi:hypothetical protein